MFSALPSRLDPETLRFRDRGDPETVTGRTEAYSDVSIATRDSSRDVWWGSSLVDVTTDETSESTEQSAIRHNITSSSTHSSLGIIASQDECRKLNNRSYSTDADQVGHGSRPRHITVSTNDFRPPCTTTCSS